MTGEDAEAPPFPPAQGILGAKVPVALLVHPFSTPRQIEHAIFTILNLGHLLQ